MHVLGTNDSCMFTIYFLGRVVLTFVKKGSSLRSPTLSKYRVQFLCSTHLFIVVFFLLFFYNIYCCYKSLHMYLYKKIDC